MEEKEDWPEPPFVDEMREAAAQQRRDDNDAHGE